MLGRSSPPRGAVLRPRLRDGRMAPRQVKMRILLAAGGLFLAFAGMTARLVDIGLQSRPVVRSAPYVSASQMAPRANIFDRNGRLLATDLITPSLYANPQLISADEASDALRDLLPDMNLNFLRERLSPSNTQFVWLRRGVSPDLAQKIHNTGLPGLDFKNELRRVYTGGSIMPHVIGFVDIDNLGRAGIESFIDTRAASATSSLLRSGRDVTLSIDFAAQYATREVLREAMQTYRARAAAGVVLDIDSGEVLAAVSLPDFDPNAPEGGLKPGRGDRLLAGSYELGSIFKLLTVAMALDTGLANLDDKFDTTGPIEQDGQTIVDAHGAGGEMTLAEIFLRSSNIGAARVAELAGDDALRKFLARVGLLEPVTTEVRTAVAPQLPPRWSGVYNMTVAFGHGIAVAPLQVAVAAAQVLNGGHHVQPTFLKRGLDKAEVSGALVVSPVTSRQMVALMRENVRNGTGRRAAVPGYGVGGKTGTAEIAVNGAYEEGRVISSFLGAFPGNRPRFVTLVTLFEPHGETDDPADRSAGRTAAPASGALIKRIAPILGVLPDYAENG